MTSRRDELEAAAREPENYARARTVNGSTELEVGGQPIIYEKTALTQALQTISDGIWPVSMVAVGDSTGNNDDEWVYLLAQALATKYPAYTVNYRGYSGTTSQYESITNLSTGTAGLAHLLTGSNAANKRFVIADSAATSITGDIDVRVKINLNGSLPSASMALCGKWGAAGTRSWLLDIGTDGKLNFQSSADGTATVSHTSSVGVSTLSSALWVRATLDVDNGAVGNTCTFMTSTDGSTWSNLGSASTAAGTTSIFDSASNTQFIGRSASSMTQQDHDMMFYGMQMYASLNGSARKVDIDVGGLLQYDFTAFPTMYDDMGNTVTIAGTYGVFTGAPRLAVFNGSVTGAVIADTHTTNYTKQIIGVPSICVINYGHNDTSDITYRADYKTLTDALLVTNPDMAIVALIQNKRKSPATAIYHHALRMDQVRKFAASQNFGIIDAFSGWPDAYTDDADGIHPNAAGKLHLASVAKRAFGLA
jgi:hypothetical protein